MWKNLVKLTARVRGSDAWNAAENRELEQCHVNNSGELLVAQHCLPRAEIVRHGESWQALSSAVSPANAVPTTSGRYRLWNGESAGGAVYVVDSVAAVVVLGNSIDVTPMSLFAATQKSPVAAITDGGFAITSLSGRSRYGGKARTDVNNAGMTSGTWDDIGRVANSPAAVAGTAWGSVDVPLFGRYVIPPGGTFVVFPVQINPVASSVRICIRWHEVVLPMVS